MTIADAMTEKAQKAVAAAVSGVTPNRIHVYNIKMFMGRVSVKGELGVFDRRGLQVSVEDGDLTTRFGMRSPTQRQSMAFEILKSEYATSFGRLLQQPVQGQG